MGGPPPTARRPVGDQLRAARDGKVQREKSKAHGLVDCHPCGRGTRWVAAKATHARAAAGTFHRPCGNGDFVLIFLCSTSIC